MRVTVDNFGPVVFVSESNDGVPKILHGFRLKAVACYRERVGEAADRAAKHLFAYSVLYLFLLFAVILVEQGFGIDGGALPLIWAS